MSAKMILQTFCFPVMKEGKICTFIKIKSLNLQITDILLSL